MKTLLRNGKENLEKSVSKVMLSGLVAIVIAIAGSILLIKEYLQKIEDLFSLGSEYK